MEMVSARYRIFLVSLILCHLVKILPSVTEPRGCVSSLLKERGHLEDLAEWEDNVTVDHKEIGWWVGEHRLG